MGVAVTGDARASASWSWEDTIGWLRTQPDQAELVVSGYYDDPLEAAACRYWRSEEWQAILSLLPTPTVGTVMDLGAGRGITSYALAKAGYRVVAVEADPSALVGAGAIRRLGQETGLPIEVQMSSSGPLPFPGESFELVFGRAVLHHLTDLEKDFKVQNILPECSDSVIEESGLNDIQQTFSEFAEVMRGRAQVDHAAAPVF